MTRESSAGTERGRRSAAWLVLLLPLAVAAPAQHDGPAHHRAAAGRGVETAPVDGSTLPATRVVDQDGRELDFYRDLVAGRTVAMNFIFTTGTTVCPPMGANFARLQRLLESGEGTAVELISVSIDSETDTPRRLPAWREKLGGDEGWTLLTGDKTRVDRLLKALRIFTPDASDHAPIALVGNDASAHTIIGNEVTGLWKKALGMAPARELIPIVRSVLEDTGAAGAGP